ncbi:MAG: hypothetical protein OEX08_02465 [Candidatus Nomurabacteria bacterium]|nr:hypothetical protein [Candidatus Nomurabacteria bacterium]
MNKQETLTTLLYSAKLILKDDIDVAVEMWSKIYPSHSIVAKPKFYDDDWGNLYLMVDTFIKFRHHASLPHSKEELKKAVDYFQQ